MLRVIDPKNVKWKYFSLDGKSEIICSDEKPSDNPVMAIITTSTWFLERSKTPLVMRRLISKLHEKIKKLDLNLCLAVPCSSLEEVREYYGKEVFYDDEGNKIDDNYVQLRMHNDLRKGDLEFIPEGFGEVVPRSMPIKEGAEQIASAIENGFDIWSIAGGSGSDPKLWLCEEYFAQQGSTEQKKPYLIGFSNVSSAQLYLRGSITPIHYLGLSWALSQDRYNESFDLILKACANQHDLTSERILPTDNIKDIDVRCKKLLKSGDIITNLTFFPCSLSIACDSKILKFQDNEKLILGLEGFFQNSSGINVHEALFKALEYKLIDPERILFISIEDIVARSEMLKIERKDGLIPDFDNLDSIGKECVKSLAKEFGVTEREYIKQSNAATLAETERVKEVAAKYQIPVVFGGQKRAGHSSNPMIQFSQVVELNLDENLGQVIQVTAPVRESTSDLSCENIKNNHPALNWPELSLSSHLGRQERAFYNRKLQYDKSVSGGVSDDEDESKKEIQEVKLQLLNPYNSLNDSENEAVIAGSSFNIVEVDSKYVAGKGIAVYLGGCGSAISELYQVIRSPQSRAAKFIILAMEIPENLQNKDEYLQSRQDIFAKVFADLGVEKPVFITTNSVNESKMTPLFSANVNLKEMILRNGVDKVSSATVKNAAFSALKEVLKTMNR